VRCDSGPQRDHVTAPVNRLIADHWCVSSERRGLTSVWRELTSETGELTSATRELTSERRDVTSVAWRAHVDGRRVPIATVEVISERYGVAARREEVSGEQRVVADKRRRVPAMGEGVPVALKRVNSAHCSAPRHRGDVMGRRRELPPFADDLAGGVCDAPSIEGVLRRRLWMTPAGNGHAGGGVRRRSPCEGLYFSNRHRSRNCCTRPQKIYNCASRPLHAPATDLPIIPVWHSPIIPPEHRLDRCLIF